MTLTPETTTDNKPHLILAGLAQQAAYAYRFAKTGHTTEALEHADAIERLISAYKSAVIPLQQPEPEGCHAGLLPLDDLAAPVERCTVRGKHTVHETTEGRKWTNADAGIEELDT
ncbi:hypothetical protein [Streptomyces cylindrosporus]|uniref:Uncharacterized protein n=1 Tax=Streptomyces cylindrosporus TaxID=2927583 RepID=A0ABS9YPU7_9ACTN|nr:hypothetical protein [Streptomyces cylindrosporus]MCI3279159.1 hypothetical protein [Streptomyces cylindrosporus]